MLILSLKKERAMRSQITVLETASSRFKKYNNLSTLFLISLIKTQRVLLDFFMCSQVPGQPIAIKL